MKSLWFINWYSIMALSNHNKFDDDEGLTFSKKLFLVIFVLFYPMLVSMYTILPPLIGLAGYIFIVNIEKRKIYSVSTFFYLLNLDLNLTLPPFFSIAITILILMFIYEPLKLLVRCRVCLLFALIVLIDFVYYTSLFIYDFIFNASTIVGDMLLVYYIAIDILVGIML